MKTSFRPFTALAASAVLITSMVAPAVAVVESPTELQAPECELWVPPITEEVEVEKAWTETIEHDAETERRWLVWSGGPTDRAPSPDSDGWNTNTQGDPNGQPHRGHDDREPYNVSQGNSGKGSWFMWETVEIQEAWTQTIDHPAVTEQVEVEPGMWVADPDCISELSAPEVVPPTCTAPGAVVVPQDTEEVHYTIAQQDADSTSGSVTVTAEAQGGRHFAEGLTTTWPLEVAPQLTETEGCLTTADPVDPETPETPETPDTPDTPDMPELPITPDPSETSDDPADPETNDPGDDNTEEADSNLIEEEDATEAEDEDTAEDDGPGRSEDEGVSDEDNGIEDAEAGDDGDATEADDDTDSTEVDDTTGDEATEDDDTVVDDTTGDEATEDDDTEVAGIVIDADDGATDNSDDTGTTEGDEDATTSDDLATTEVLGVTVEQDGAELAHTGASTTLLLLLAALSLLAGGVLLRRRTGSEIA